MKPSHDPNCQRYIDDPSYSWHSGAWRTVESIERKRERTRVWHLERFRADPVWRERRRARKRIENMAPALIERKRERDREASRRYAQTGRGYLTRRRRELLVERARVTNQLEEIREELKAWQ